MKKCGKDRLEVVQLVSFKRVDHESRKEFNCCVNFKLHIHILGVCICDSGGVVGKMNFFERQGYGI